MSYTKSPESRKSYQFSVKIRDDLGRWLEEMAEFMVILGQSRKANRNAALERVLHYARGISARQGFEEIVGR